MRFCFGIAIFHVFALIALHVTYVGPYAFARQRASMHSLINCIANALSTRPIEDRSTYFGNDDTAKDENDSDDGISKRFLAKGANGAILQDKDCADVDKLRK